MVLAPAQPITSFPIYKAIRSCNECRLRRGCVGPVPGIGPMQAHVVVVGESPGEREDETGIPFTGQTGRLLDHLLRMAGTSREAVYLTNIVKCPSYQDASFDLIQTCTKNWLDGLELPMIQPKVIVAMGQAAIRHILKDHTLTVEHTHGIPHFIDGPNGPKSIMVFPTYNPAAGLRNTSQLRQIWDDWNALGLIFDGMDPMDLVPIDQWPKPQYVRVEREQDAREILHLPEYALDTETVPVSAGETGRALIGASAVGIGSDPSGRAHRLWSVQVSNQSGTAYFIPAELVPDPATAIPSTSTVYVHNYLYDRQFINIPTYVDTMVAAYLLGMPQGLKQLSYRIAGMEMHSYEEYVYSGPEGIAMAIDYLYAILEREDEWPAPEILYEDKWSDAEGMITRKPRKPQHIVRKVKRIISDFDKNPNVNLVQRWRNIDARERKIVEASLGAMPEPSLANVDPEASLFYSARDADATWRIKGPLLKSVQESGMNRVLHGIDLPVLAQIAEMMDTGIMIDEEHFSGLSVEYLERLKTSAVKCAAVGGYGSFNPNSPVQVANLLYSTRKLGYPVTRWSDSGNPRRDGSLDVKSFNTGTAQVHYDTPEPEPTGGKPARPSTDDREMKKTGHPVVDEIIEYRGVLKNKTSFADSLLEKAHPETKRVHGTIRATRVETGRLSMSDPNLMAIPVRTAEGRRIREGFIAAPGKIFVAIDYSQIEMRVMAHYTGSPYLAEIFFNGWDFHTATAARMFHVGYDDVETGQRYAAKRMNFGIIYGITALGLLEGFLEEGATEWTLEGCEELIEMYDASFPEVAEYRKDQIEFGTKHGYVQDMFGRRRFIPELICPIPRIRGEGQRAAGNMPIQSSAQGIIKQAGNRLYYLREQGEAPCDFRFLLQIHDEIFIELDEAYEIPFIKWAAPIMENIVQLSVPVVAEAKSGKAWGTMKGVDLSSLGDSCG